MAIGLRNFCAGAREWAGDSVYGLTTGSALGRARRSAQAHTAITQVRLIRWRLYYLGEFWLPEQPIGMAKNSESLRYFYAHAALAAYGGKILTHATIQAQTFLYIACEATVITRILSAFPIFDLVIVETTLPLLDAIKGDEMSFCGRPILLCKSVG